MLNTLDIVIGFAVIMTVLSLFITILVQMVSTALALRGKNLANALAITFQTIDPKIGAQAHSLAAQILRDPIFSDSIWQDKKRKAVQAAAAEIGKLAELIKAEREVKLVARSLAKTVDEAARQVFQQTAEAGKAAVAELRKVVKISKVSDNRSEPWGFWTWPSGGARQLGTAIRPGEVYRVLHELAEMTETEAALKGVPPRLVTAATELIAALEKSDRPTIEAQQKLGLINNVSQLFKAVPLQQVAVLNALPNFGATVEHATTMAYDRFQRWFGSGQDRAEQWFQTHMRGVTIVMAALLAFVLQLDTIQIYRQLRDQPTLTAALVKAAPAVLEQGSTVLDPANTGAYHAYLLWLQKHPLFPLKTLPAQGSDASYRQAVADRIKGAPDPEYPAQQFDKAFELASNAEGFSGNTEGAAARAAYAEWLKNFPMFALDAEPDDAATRQSVHDAIQARVSAAPDAKAPPDETKANEWLAEYDSLQPAGRLALQSARQNAVRDLQKQMDAAGFSLAPLSLFGRWDGEKLPPWATGIHPPVAAHYLVHLLGVLMTVGLLTLGAPFWFNLLKNLTSLRPALAALVEKRPTSAPALPQTPAQPGTS